MGTLSGVPLFCFGFFQRPEHGAHAGAAFGGVLHGERAAEPYFRDKTAARDGEHFGLGLYICRTLAERHGGALTVENAPEGGGRVRAAFRVMEEAKTEKGNAQ